ncbi:putative DNA-binding WGR domain protein [Breznakia sp. PF5-3]|uniref:DUF6138 family protein n=1 Tax=unclassified Breznakia TaxID=2623764 RepID=UPI002404EEFC|nr:MULTISPECIES: DUF6138 family protein [unclassified Breznakia]MDF9823831.1 putative DNA-binding WGR domain protein [Breznakia sp. PM6-1]MDF9834603.1 putative DNA-binding WGR domain protein [Breznakia sp. PF5-3]MDF9836780.1 putative DNA-binding WGR domain protein [Breznakia sp. PFB2-8]MDF9858771.1 putative DNA-binding WGR domain protein [Breznakia sp. PH5-24]
MYYYLEFKEEGSNKFWKLELEENSYTLTYGKIGSAGTSKVKTFESAEKAEKDAMKLVAAKRKKGYVDAEPEMTMELKKKPKETKKVIIEKPEKIPLPLKDDDKIKAWHDEELEEEFKLSNMRMGTSKSSTSQKEKKEKVETEDGMKKLEDLMLAHMNHNFIKSKIDRERLFLTLCQKGEYEEAKLVYEIVGFSDKVLKSAVKQIFENKASYTPTLQLGSFMLVEWLYDLLNLPFDQFLALISQKDIHVDVLEKYYTCLKDTKAFGEAKEQMLSVVKELCESNVSIIENTIKGVCDYAKNHTAFNAKDINKLDQIIKEQKFVEGAYGISIAFKKNHLYVGVLGTSLSGFSGIYTTLNLHGVSVKFFIEMIKEELTKAVEKLWDDNIFEGLFRYTCTIEECETKTELLYREIPSEERDELLKRLEHLEISDDWEENIELLSDVVEECKAGIYMKYDEDRIVSLVSRYMKSPDSSVSDSAENIMSMEAHKRTASDAWVEAMVTSYCDRGHFKEARSRYVDKARKRTSPEVTNKLRKLISFREKNNRALMSTSNNNAVSTEDIDNDYVLFGKGSQIKDTFLETENVVVRADEDGRIMVRFLNEGEAAYSETLDFVNHLLSKGYGKIGQYFCVRFLHEPMAIKQVGTLKTSYGITYPFNDTHAFFARAAQYPKLRSKVERYAYLALKKYEWYPDLDAEENTVPGTFAATALAFCGAEYMPVVIHYAHMVDGDHSNLHAVLPNALIKHYGLIPEIAPAIFALCMANGQDYDYSIPTDLLANKEFAKYIMRDIHKWEVDDREKQSYFTTAVRTILYNSSYADDGVEALNKIKKYINNSDDIQTRGGLIEFYNYYLECIKQYDDYEDIKPIIQLKGYRRDDNLDEVENHIDASKQVELTFEEKGVVLMTMSEAKKAKVNFDDMYERKDLDAVFYINSIQDDIEILDYFNRTAVEIGYENHTRMGKRCRTVWTCGADFVSNGKWVVDTTHMGANAATIIFNGKNKPTILYGYMNFVDAVIEYKTTKPTSEEEIETLRLRHLKKQATPRKYDSEYKEAEELLDELMYCIIYGTFPAADYKIQQLEANDNCYVEMVRKVAKIQVLQRGGRIEGYEALCDELSKMQSDKRDFWLAKKAIAKTLQKNNIL